MTALAYNPNNFRRYQLDTVDTGISDDATSLHNIVSNVIRRIYDAADEHKKHTAIDSLLSELEAEYGEEDWDGYGSEPVSKSAINYTKKFINGLPSTISLPEVDVDSDGDILLEWYKNQNKLINITISANSNLFFAARFSQVESTNGKNYFSGIIPKNVIESIQRVCK